jgi:murein DD-endopeptidase MepM/ murein hydrolase activator NlpD
MPVRAWPLLFASAALALLLFGCRPRTSPEYEEAHQRFSQLYAVHLDAAYARPEMDSVVSLLEAVPPSSLDAAAARELLARILAGRAQLAQEEELRRGIVREMLAAPVEEADASLAVARPLDAGASPLLALEGDAGQTRSDGGLRRARSLSACVSSAVRVLLPFEPRDTAFVSQGNNGRFTHQGASRFAFDFNVPIGTAIVAALPGVVLQTQDRFDRSADMDPEQYNFVLIDHGHGVLTEYGHLRYHGTRVRPAQRVAQGELLGYSGDTGMSTGPHLHFAVVDAALQSQPACFLDVESGVPRAGEVVESGNLAGPEFLGEFRPATLPKDAFASQQIALDAELPLLLPNTIVEIRGRVGAASREVVLWVRPQGVKEPTRRLVAPVDAEGRFSVAVPLEGLEGIQWIGFTRVQPRGAWKGWSVRRFAVAAEAARDQP